MGRLYHVLLAIPFLASEVGLTILNRITLSTGVYKFPFPITLAFLQVLATACLATAATYVLETFRFCHIPGKYNDAFNVEYRGRPKARGARACYQHLLPSLPEYNEPSATTATDRSEGVVDFNWCSQIARAGKERFSNGLRGGNITARRHWAYAKTLLYLAIAFAGKVALGHLLLSRVPFAVYTLVQIAALPMSLAFTALINGEQPSGISLTLTHSAALSLAYTAIPLLYPIGLGDTFLSILTALCVALVPVLLLAVFRRNSDDTAQYMRLAEVLDAEPSGLTSATQRRILLKNFCRTICHITQIATILLIPVLLLSGELLEIQKNSYILDVDWFWRGLASTSVLNGLSLVLSLLLAKNLGAFKSTFLHVPSFSLLLIILKLGKSTPQGWINLVICVVSCLALLLSKDEEGTKSTTSGLRKVILSFRNVIIVLVVYAAICQAPHLLFKNHLSNITTDVGTDDQNAHTALLSKPTIKIHDDYLGTRPHPDTVADIPLITTKCGEVANGLGVDDVVQCLAFLESGQDEYFNSPENGLQSEVGDSKGAYSTCDKTMILFHAYWTGHGTWRFELFIKAYLYTQYLPCSRLWIWLDSDIDPKVLDRMLHHDPVVEHFRHLVDNGDIVFKNWTIPTRIPLPGGIDALNTTHLYRTGHRNAAGEVSVADDVIQDANGNFWLVPNPVYISAASAVAVSDAVRFIVLHHHGGVYLDMDVLLLRDLRPFILPGPTKPGAQTAFAEQWVERCPPSDYNTAVIALTANSSLSSYLVHGGLRMGMNFHPKVIGRMMWKDGRNGEVAMLQNAVFDPLVTNLRREGTDSCTVPCHKNFQSSFLARVEEPWNEWRQYKGEPAERIQTNATAPTTLALENGQALVNNRSLEHFFRGAFAYHIHNQWDKFPEPTSWMDVITAAQDGFFKGERTNAYGEVWGGGVVGAYERVGWGWV